MRDDTEKRAVELGEYIAQNRVTVREAAKHFCVSKSTVFSDVSERLKGIDFILYEKVRLVLQTNKAERHLRGGQATKQKYKGG